MLRRKPGLGVLSVSRSVLLFRASADSSTASCVFHCDFAWSRTRSMFHAATSASKGVPSWNATPGRSLKTRVFGSGCSHDSARSPTIFCSPVFGSASSKRTRVLYMASWPAMNGWLERWGSRLGYVQLIDWTKVPPRLMAEGWALATGARAARSAAPAPPRPVRKERRLDSPRFDLWLIDPSFPVKSGVRRQHADSRMAPPVPEAVDAGTCLSHPSCRRPLCPPCRSSTGARRSTCSRFRKSGGSGISPASRRIVRAACPRTIVPTRGESVRSGPWSMASAAL